MSSMSTASTTIPNEGSPCMSPDCPVKIPHDTGVYLHKGKVPLEINTYTHPTFGASNPPPNLWAARMRIINHECSVEDIELVVAFNYHHGRTEKAYGALEERAKQLHANQPRLFELSGLQNIVIRTRPVLQLGTRPSLKLARIKEKNGGGAMEEDVETGTASPETRDAIEQMATDEDFETGAMTPDTIEAFEREFEETIAAMAKEGREAEQADEALEAMDLEEDDVVEEAEGEVL